MDKEEETKNEDIDEEKNEWVSPAPETGEGFYEGIQSERSLKSQLDWEDLIGFVEKQKKKNDMLEIDERIDQDTKETKAAILEERLKIQEEINLKLVARIKLLEYALQQMSSKRNSGRPDLAGVTSAYNDNLGIKR
ncbi:unnamed protein product [Moneuplotes crassus]|uniref:Uncharacterized protein n=1 Tax=Euplotes crassus TaxID=5936 RepID=A0AAD1X2F2_EUPCR|nr:unnamed protein product [Moneuplotes crassus]